MATIQTTAPRSRASFIIKNVALLLTGAAFSSMFLVGIETVSLERLTSSSIAVSLHEVFVPSSSSASGTASVTLSPTSSHTAGASSSPSVPASASRTPSHTPSSKETPSQTRTSSVTRSSAPTATQTPDPNVDITWEWGDVLSAEWKAQEEVQDEWTRRRRVAQPQEVGFSETDQVPKGYIITGDVSGGRYKHTAVRAAAIGHSPIAHIGRWPHDSLRDTFMTKSCAVKYAHVNAWERLARDASVPEDGWAFFYEDDIGFTPPATPPQVHAAWRLALKHPTVSRRGALFLGICGRSGFSRGHDPLQQPVPPVPAGDGIDDGRSGYSAHQLRAFARGWWNATYRNESAGKRVRRRLQPDVERDSGQRSGDTATFETTGVDRDTRYQQSGTQNSRSIRSVGRRRLAGGSWPSLFGGGGGAGGGTVDGSGSDGSASASVTPSRSTAPTATPTRSDGPLRYPTIELGPYAATFPGDNATGTQPLSIHLHTTRANGCGACMHAYGLRKDVARHLARRMQQLTPEEDDACDMYRALRRGIDPRARIPLIYQDTALLEVCRTDWLGEPVLGVNLVSPDDGSHVGVFYQDRRSFSSTLADGNYGTKSRGYIRRESWETDETFA